MDERFLESQRRDPRPEFARELRESLAGAEEERDGQPPFRAGGWLAAAAVLAAVVGAFAFPAVRASAQAVLDLFRIREFSVIQVDETRMQQLRDRKFDPATLIAGKAVVLQDPGAARPFTSVEAAASATGLPLERPALLPRRLALDSVFVRGEGRTRATVDTKPLLDLMQAFDIRDLTLPTGLDGGSVEVHIPTVVIEKFTSPGQARATFVQCAAPEVALPAGVDLPRLGEIGLRLLGLPPADAHRLGGRIDWRSTLVVPVVGSATSFQQVDVNSAHGVYLETAHTGVRGGEDQGPGGMLLWSHDGRVYAMMGRLDRVSLVQMAESVH